jgi:hypothetical protein
MWQLYAIIAQDLIRDRQADARAEALYRTLLLEADGVAPLADRPGIIRRTSVASLRRLEAAAAWVSRRACSTATRLEREPA